MTIDIAAKIQERSYQSPGRARAAVQRSHLGTAAKRKLGEAITLWESEGSMEPPVIGALPEREASERRTVHEAELVEVTNGYDQNGQNGQNDQTDHRGKSGTIDSPSRASLRAEGPFTLPLRLNLNCMVRARLTPFGVHILYAARGKVPIPENLLSNCAVWETTLAHFMVAFGSHLEGPDGDVPVAGFEIELYRLRP